MGEETVFRDPRFNRRGSPLFAFSAFFASLRLLRFDCGRAALCCIADPQSAEHYSLTLLLAGFCDSHSSSLTSRMNIIPQASLGKTVAMAATLFGLFLFACRTD